MYCTKCGKEMPDNAAVCADCGATVVVDKSHETVGLLSMIFGLVALGTQVTGIASSLSLPAAIIAVVCGFIAKSQAAKVGKTTQNAQTGLICGFITIGINVVYSILAVLFLIFYFLFYFLIIFGVLGASMGAGMYI